MKIFCKLCSRKFESSAPAEEAETRIMKPMVEHLAAEHVLEAQKLAITIETCHKLMAAYLLLEQVYIPEDETQLREWADKCEAELAGVFGFDVTAIGEDDESEPATVQRR